MFDTMRLNKSRLLVFLVIATFTFSLLPLPRSGIAYVVTDTSSTNASKVIPKKPPVSAASAPAPQTPITYDLCLQDDSNNSTLSLNTTTGDYIFTCGNCVKKTGKGSLTTMG